MSRVPTPRYDLLKMNQYLFGSTLPQTVPLAPTRSRHARRSDAGPRQVVSQLGCVSETQASVGSNSSSGSPAMCNRYSLMERATA